MKFKILSYFTLWCLKSWINPRNFFQIHAKFFNEKKWIFSKLDLESHIPEKWRLTSYKVTSWDTVLDLKKQHGFPFIWKPEWWQNAHWVRMIRDENDLENFLYETKNSEISYLVQEYSDFDKEFEVSYTKDHSWEISIWSIVESKNIDNTNINSIHGKTKYHELLDTVSSDDIEKIKRILLQLNDFKLARVGLKADSISDFISEKFKIYEINIFIPLPLILLADNISSWKKHNFLKAYTKNMTTLTKHREKSKYKEVFFRKIFLHYKIKLSQNKIYLKGKRRLYSWIEDNFMNWCSDYNSIDVRRACRSKKQARDMFAKNNIPHAKWEIFVNPFKAHNFAKKHWFPLVIKPNVWWYSRWSYFPIMNFKDLWKAIFLAKLWWPASVIETYLLWKNYRVVVTKNSVDIAMQRTPATIIWDGKTTISDLIDFENETRRDMNLDPIIHLIEKSRWVKKHIKKQWYHLESKLEKWKKIELYHRVSLAPGWILYTIDTDTISIKNKEIFKRILNEFDANIFWIDVIMEKGIEVDYDKQKTIFLELNSRPYLKMHTVPRIGKSPNMKPLYKKLDALEIAWKWLF